jgi:hypothetical protein
MAFTLGGYDLSAVQLVVPRFGIWTAETQLVDGRELAAGAAVELVVGDLTLRGTVRSGGTYVSSSSYTVVGGADGWPRRVPERGYRDDGGSLTLAIVAADLAAAAGESVQLEPNVDRVLGYAWTRIAGSATAALRDLVGSAWWMAADGVTHLGPRPSSSVSSSVRFSVEQYDPTRRRALLSSPEDVVAAFLPGAVWSADEVPSFTVTGLVARASAGSVQLEVYA